MSVWVEKVEKDYYQCNSCGMIDDLVKIRYGQIEESTSSFRMCNNCLSLIPNSQKDEMVKSLEANLALAIEALEFYEDKKSWQTNSGSRHLANAILDHDLYPLANFGGFENEIGGKLARKTLAEIKGASE